MGFEKGPLPDAALSSPACAPEHSPGICCFMSVLTPAPASASAAQVQIKTACGLLLERQRESVEAGESTSVNTSYLTNKPKANMCTPVRAEAAMSCEGAGGNDRFGCVRGACRKGGSSLNWSGVNDGGSICVGMELVVEADASSGGLREGSGLTDRAAAVRNRVRAAEAELAGAASGAAAAEEVEDEEVGRFWNALRGATACRGGRLICALRVKRSTA